MVAQESQDVTSLFITIEARPSFRGPEGGIDFYGCLQTFVHRDTLSSAMHGQLPVNRVWLQQFRRLRICATRLRVAIPSE
jgi:hypothetical protein